MYKHAVIYYLLLQERELHVSSGIRDVVNPSIVKILSSSREFSRKTQYCVCGEESKKNTRYNHGRISTIINNFALRSSVRLPLSFTM